MLYVKLDKPTSLHLSSSNNSYHGVVGRGKQTKQHAGRRDTRKKWPRRRTGGRNSLKYQGHLAWDSANQSYHFCIYPLSSVSYFENYSQANHKHFNGLCSDDMSPAHAPTETKQNKKRKTKEVPFHIRHRTKLTPFTYSRRKWVLSWLLFFSFAITCL